MSKKLSKDNVFILNEYLQILLELVEDKINKSQKDELNLLLGDTAKDDKISFNKLKKVLDIIFRTQPLDSIALLFGTNLLPSNHGFFGYAIKSAANFEEALNITAKYLATRLTIFRIDLIHEDRDMVILFTENVNRSRHTDFILISMLLAFSGVGLEMFRHTKLSTQELENLPFISLKMKAKTPNIRGLNIKFSHFRNEIRFDRSYLREPLSSRDDGLHKLMLNQIKGDAETYFESSLVNAIRSFVERDYGLQSTQDDLASEMCMSPRTLKRRLSESNISYREILKQARKEKAITLLTQTILSVDEISEEVGYSDTSNFCRAFRQWTGVSPKQYRENEL